MKSFQFDYFHSLMPIDFSFHDCSSFFFKSHIVLLFFFPANGQFYELLKEYLNIRIMKCWALQYADILSLSDMRKATLLWLKCLLFRLPYFLSLFLFSFMLVLMCCFYCKKNVGVIGCCALCWFLNNTRTIIIVWKWKLPDL